MVRRGTGALLLWVPVIAAMTALVGAAPRSPATLRLDETAYSPWASVAAANLDQKNLIDGDVVHTPNDRLQSVSCTGGQCMAVGQAATLIDGFDTQETLAERSTDGGEWTLTPSPNPAREDGDSLAGVSCVSASLCMAVGTQEGGLFNGNGATLAEVWDGTAWTATPTPNPSPSSFWGVSCPDAATCYAVGNQDGSNGGLIEKASLQGAYVNAAGGSAVSGEQTASPNGVYTATWANASSVTVTKHLTGGGTQDLFTVPATEGGFSPDSRTFVTATLNGGVEHVALYPLLQNATAIYTAGPTVTSSRLVFSPSGHYLLFGYTTPTQTFFEVANAYGSAQSANVFTTGGIDAASPPGSGNDKFGSVTYGFGPDDSRFVYGYVAPGAQTVNWRWTNLTEDAPQQINSFTMNATSGYFQFSPSAKFLAFVNGDGTGQARVDLFDSTSGADVGAAGPANAGGSPPDLEAGTGGQTATIGSATYNMTTQTDFSWSVIAAPQPTSVTPPTGVTAGAFDSEGFDAISCVSADDCTAVGEYQFKGTVSGTGQQDFYGGPLVVHWDGSSWKVVYDPDTGKVSTGLGVVGISCLTDASSATGDACIVSGSAAASIGLIQLKPTGGWTSWRQVTGPKLASRINYYLAGISCVTADDCTAVGFSGHGQGSGGNQNSMAVHYDGTQWSFESVPGLDGDHLDAVSCWAAEKCTAVGATYGGAEVPTVGFTTDPATLVVEQGQAATADVSVSADDVAWGSEVTFSLSLGGPATPASGTVLFEGGTECTAALTEGHASCTAAAENPGTGPVEAFLVYHAGSGPDQDLSGSWRGPNLTVEPPPTTTEAAVSPGSVTVGDTVTYSATVDSFDGSPDSGTVKFSIGSLVLCTAQISSGQGSCASAGAPVGGDTVKAAYSGYWAFGASSGTTQLTVAPAGGAAATTTAVTVTPTETGEGQTVGYSATVSASSGTPTGNVSFGIGSTDLCTATLSGGAATCRSAAAPAGSDTVTGTYSGDPDFGPSTGTTPLTVDAATRIPRLFMANSGNDTLTTYAASFSGNVASASTISDDGSGTALDAPSAAAFDGSGHLWVANCATSSVSEYTASELAPSGAPAPAARLTDDGSGTLTCPDALAFDSSGNLWVADSGSGLVAEFTAADLASLGTTSDPSAAVTISDDGDANLRAPNGLAFDPAGDLWVADSTADDVVEFTPGQLAASGAPTPAGQLFLQANAVAFDSSGDLWVGLSGVVEDFTPDQLTNLASQPAPPPAVRIDTGSSDVLSDADALGFDSRGNLWVASAAQSTSSLLEFGTSELSESGSVTPIDVVSGSRTGLAASAGLAVEDGTLPAGSASATPGTVVKGDRVTYSATISGSSATPAGTVTFSTGDVALCTATLSGGSGSCDSTAAPIGTDDVTAIYSGDGGYAGAVLGTSVDVAPPPANVQVSAQPSPATAGQNVELSVTVSGPGGTPTGSVDLTYQGQELCSVGLDGSGAGSCVAAAPPAGDDTITASYSGDPDFAASTGTLDLTSRAPGPAAPSIVVADQSNSELQSFPLPSTGDALPTTTVSDSGSFDLREPDALTVDGSGNLWVANRGSGKLLEYTTTQLAVDGSPAPAVAISSPNLDIPSALAFDGHGNLWEADSEDGDIVEFGHDQLVSSGDVGAAAVLHSSAFDEPVSLAFDGAGDLWVLNVDGLLEFTPDQLAAAGDETPTVEISDDGSGDLFSAAGLAFDSSGNLWVAGSSGLALFTPAQLAASGSPTPDVTIGDDGSGTLSSPAQLAFDDGGNLWVASEGDAAVLEYTPDQLASSGQPTPAAVIGGPTTQLQEPTGLAILGAAAAPPPPTETLTVTRAGTGTGTVTSSPAGISCGSTCSYAFAEGASVTLTATPADGSVFGGWSGACSGSGTCTVQMSSARSVTATFSSAPPPAQTLTVSKAGSGAGTVTSSPAGISCGSTCSSAFPAGTSVTLTATPAAGSVFAGWSGACSGSGTCTVQMSSAQSVTATFSLVPPPPPGPQTLSVTKTSVAGGAGTVASSPAGISCGTTCTASFAYGSAVTLTAAASPGSAFGGWSGACTGTGPCVVDMTSAQSVTASFTFLSPPPPPKPLRCVVPRVKGKTLGAARKAIAKAHCTAKVATAYSSKVRKGVVISQNPRPGTRLRKGGKVTVVVSKGKRPRHK